MRYLDLVAQRPLVWGLFLVFLAGTAYLAWLGHKKTTDLKDYSVGRGDMGPVLVGITLASSIASTATFVINPGFVYAHGVAAFMHLGVAAGLGLVTGLVALSFGFRRIGEKTKALTLPHWIGERYGSRALAVLFAAINILSLTFVVLICGGVSIVMQQVLGLTNTEALVLTIGFVFGYIMVGGTYAHAYTNTMQGIVMAVIAAVIVASGFRYFADGIGPAMDRIARLDPALVMLTNPKSELFGSVFSVYVSGFVVGFALVCQPHILSKALYVRTDRDVRRYLAVTVAVSLVFTALLLAGFYALLADLPREALVDPATGRVRQDSVMAVYLSHTFGPTTLAFVTVAVLAAGMSTLDGLLVALSSIAANDLFLGLTEGTRLGRRPMAERLRIAHRVSQLVLVLLGVLAFVIALHPPKLLGIFGQIGVYGIVAASAVPILAGIFLPEAGRRTAGAAALVGLFTHAGLYGLGASGLGGAHAVELGLANPASTATIALFASAACAVPALVARLRGHERGGGSELPVIGAVGAEE
jgi:SSS family solute:Na+ symporter/sodium/pantothenate symporter